MTSSGFEPAIVRLVAQCLNHVRYRVPPNVRVRYGKTVRWFLQQEEGLISMNISRKVKPELHLNNIKNVVPPSQRTHCVSITKTNQSERERSDTQLIP
jgi:hypothetical protein